VVNQQFAFALHILAMLACSGGTVDSRTVAASVNTNPVVIRRLLLALRRAGLVETSAGKRGGARLKKKPADVTLLDIYNAIELRPAIAINERHPFKKCRVSCCMQPIMEKISEGAEEAMRSHLRRTTLREVMRRIK